MSTADEERIVLTVGQRIPLRHNGKFVTGVVNALRDVPWPGEVDIALDDGTVVTVPVALGW